MIQPAPHTQPDSTEGDAEPTGIPGTVERARGLMLEAVIEPVLATLGYELVHLEWTAAGRQRKLQVFVDHAEGIDLEDCARLSPILGNALDAAETADAAERADTAGAEAGTEFGGELARLLQAPYVLEVSSPGLERPLSRRSHYARFIGRLCRVRAFSPLTPGDAQRNFHGRIEAALPDPDKPDDDRSGTVTLRDPDGGHEHRIPIERVRRARLVYEG
jgi:ribosome maturation factor RimP